MWNIWICTIDWLYLFTFFSGHFIFVIHLDERGHGNFKYLVRVRRDTADLSPLSTKSYFTVATIHLKKTKRFIGKQFYCIRTFMYRYKCNFNIVIKRLEAGFSKQFGKKDTVHVICFRFFTVTVYDFSLNAFIITRNWVWIPVFELRVDMKGMIIYFYAVIKHLAIGVLRRIGWKETVLVFLVFIVTVTMFLFNSAYFIMTVN